MGDLCYSRIQSYLLERHMSATNSVACFIHHSIRPLSDLFQLLVVVHSVLDRCHPSRPVGRFEWRAAAVGGAELLHARLSLPLTHSRTHSHKSERTQRQASQIVFCSALFTAGTSSCPPRLVFWRQLHSIPREM